MHPFSLSVVLIRWRAETDREYYHQLAEKDKVRFSKATQERLRLITDMNKADAAQKVLEQQHAEQRQIARLEKLRQKELAAKKRARYAPKRVWSKKQM